MTKKGEAETEERLIWEVIAVIHTFSGSIMLSAISATVAVSSFFIIGIFLFFGNFIIIFSGVHNKKGKIAGLCIHKVTFIIAMLTIVFFMLALFGLTMQLAPVQPTLIQTAG